MSAEVFINETREGKTPLQTYIEPSDYKIRLSAAGYNDIEFNLTAKPGDVVLVQKQLLKAK